VARDAIARKTGARGLRSVIEKRLIRVQYDLPDLKDKGAVTVRVTAKVIEGTMEPLVLFDAKAANE
jgi:ATP-dependent Clp protease ATP-binding subunit ClpX